MLRTLQGRGYIDVVGHDSGPGQATLYGTTVTFLEKLGLDRIEDLPPIAEFIPGADVVEALEVGLRVTDAPTSLTTPTTPPGPEPPLWEQLGDGRRGAAGRRRAERRAPAEGAGDAAATAAGGCARTSSRPAG